MAYTCLHQSIPASAAAVWSVVGDEDAAGRWAAVDHADVEGHGIGARRTVHLVDGTVIRERLEAFDPAGRRTRWEVLSFSRIPLRELHYTVSVAEDGPDACDVAWELDFEPASDASEERVRGMLEGIFGSIRASILETLELR